MNRSSLVMSVIVSLWLSVAVLTGAAETSEESSAPLPFPLHTVEGTGGVILVPTAYLVNPAVNGAVGLPAMGAYYADLNRKDFSAITLTETLWDRVELGYSFNNLQLGGLRSDISAATGLDIGTNHVQMHNFNVRVNLLKEGAFELGWLPAVTAGVHYKHNEDIDALDGRLGGLLDMIGVKDDESFDFTLVASKTVGDPLPRPLILSLCGRLTEANQLGLLGFTDHYKAVAGASAVCLLTDRLALAAEYRIKPDELKEVPGLIEQEDNWWDAGFCYIISENLTITAGYVDFGHVLNDKVHGGWIASVKWEF